MARSHWLTLAILVLHTFNALWLYFVWPNSLNKTINGNYFPLYMVMAVIPTFGQMISLRWWALRANVLNWRDDGLDLEANTTVCQLYSGRL